MFFNIPPMATTFATTTSIVSQAHEDTSKNSSNKKNVKKQVEAVIAANQQQNILTGVSINDKNKNIISNDVNTEHFAASVNKAPVSVLLLKKLRAGQITLDTVLSWTADDIRGGAGVFDQPGAPLSGTVRDLLKDMLHYSGNTAVRVIVNGALGGAPQVNTVWQSQYGLTHTYLMPLDGPGGRFYFGNTSTKEALKMFKLLAEGNDSYARLVRGFMADNIWDEMGVRSVLRDTARISLINKIGYLDDPDGNNRHDVGMIINKRTGRVYTYAFLQTAPSATPAPTTQANAALRQLGVITLKAAGDRYAGAPAADAQPFARQSPRAPESRILY